MRDQLGCFIWRCALLRYFGTGIQRYRLIAFPQKKTGDFSIPGFFNTQYSFFLFCCVSCLVEPVVPRYGIFSHPRISMTFDIFLAFLTVVHRGILLINII